MTAATAHAACTTAEDIGADAILTVSQGGITAQMVSRFRPEATVVALLLDPQIQRQMALYWGLVPIMMKRAENSDELVHSAVETAGSRDPEYMARACAAFFQAEFTQTADGVYQF